MIEPITQPVSTIIIPTRPQPDTIVAIFLLQTFGKEIYADVDTAKFEVDPKATDAPDKLLLDVGGGELDHHGTDLCASELVAKKLILTNKPELRNLIAYARRDDTEGKGTVSKDPLDRAFGLSGLIASLNKQNPIDPQYVINTTLPLLRAHYYTANEHHVELPKHVKGLQQTDMFKSETIQKPFRNMKVAFVTSDHIGLAGYLRSVAGGGYSLIAQRRTSGHVNVLTKQNPKIDLSRVIAMLRLYEANLHKVEIEDERSLRDTGTHKLVPNWYYDPATNSLLNGGVTPDSIESTKIDWPELQAIILHSLQN